MMRAFPWAQRCFRRSAGEPQKADDGLNPDLQLLLIEVLLVSGNIRQRLGIGLWRAPRGYLLEMIKDIAPTHYAGLEKLSA